MAKTTKLKARVSTLVKDFTGKKVRVKENEIFKVDVATAEIYLKTYPRIFEAVGNTEIETVEGKENPEIKERIIELENENEKLLKENEEQEKTIETLKVELKELEIEKLRIQYEGVELEEIPMQDLRKIAVLKNIEIPTNPKKIELVKLIEEQNKEGKENDGVE